MSSQSSRSFGNSAAAVSVLSRPRPTATFQCREMHVNRTLVRRERTLGFHDGQRLMLGELEIVDRDIKYVACQENRLHIGWDDVDGNAVVASMLVDQELPPILSALNYGLSRRTFDETLQKAAAENLGHLCRDTECQHCQAKVLTREEYPYAPQVYCSWCDSLNTTIEVENLGEIERNYRICSCCGMYSRPRKFTIGYFWFLIVHAGVTHRVTHRCPGCMRKEAWKMVFGNLPGLLGMPLAITQLVRVYRDSIKKGPFRGMDEANRLLRRGKTARALSRYSSIIERHPVNAGVLYNIALGLLAQGDDEHARQTLEMALENCPSYEPARQLMQSRFPKTNPPTR